MSQASDVAARRADRATASLLEAVGPGTLGVGDVLGPASANDNRVARFDGASGKLLQNSVAALDDSGNASGFVSVAIGATPATVGAVRLTNNQFIFGRFSSVDLQLIGVDTGANVVIGANATDNIYNASSAHTIKINNVTVFQAVTNTLGVFNHTPAAQTADSGALTDSTGGTVDGTLVDVTTATLADPVKINNNFADLAAKYDALRAHARAHGWMA
jgi:hypothetical protein